MSSCHAVPDDGQVHDHDDGPVATVHGTEVRCDWLAVTFHDYGELTLRQRIGALLGEPGFEAWDQLKSGISGYRVVQQGPRGVLVASTPRRGDCHLILRGKGCASLTPAEMKNLLEFCYVHGNPTRVDLALDDFEMRVDPGFVLDAFRSCSAVTRAKRSRRIKEEDRGGRRLGDGIQIGSRSGICFLRVYDKELESGGARACIRWELQTKERAAAALLHDLVEHEELGKVFAEHLVRFLDFRQPGLGAASVRPREPWFADLVGAAEKAVLAQPERTTSLASALAWIHKQVVPWLGVLWHLSGRRNKEFLQVLDLDNAMYRWKPPHLKALKEGPAALQAHLDRPSPPAA